MPLSEKSRTTLRLMGETDGEEGFAVDDAKRREPESPNAHLPFVMDVYGVKPVTTKTLLKAEPQVAEDQADVQDAQLTVIEATDVQAEPEVAAEADTSHEHEHEDVSEPEAQASADAGDDAETADQDSQDLVQAQAPEDTLSESAPDLEATEAEEVVDAASEQVEPDLAESELITDDNAGEPQALGAEVEELLAQAPAPAVTVVGIDPEEVAQREAAQFAQGLAQGIEQGERQAREAMQQEVAAQCAVLSAVTHDLNALLQDPKKFFEPLKRLALHVAEHVVMKELNTSTEAIERLVQRCLDELDHPAKGAVVVELNPQDKERLQAQDSALVAGMRLDAVKGMKPGSVRLFANDTVVEDLVEHRLEALARSLLVDVEDWRAKSALAQPEIEVSEPEVEDVEPNDVHS